MLTRTNHEWVDRPCRSDMRSTASSQCVAATAVSEARSRILGGVQGVYPAVRAVQKNLWARRRGMESEVVGKAYVLDEEGSFR